MRKQSKIHSTWQAAHKGLMPIKLSLSAFKKERNNQKVKIKTQTSTQAYNNAEQQRSQHC